MDHGPILRIRCIGGAQVIIDVWFAGLYVNLSNDDANVAFRFNDGSVLEGQWYNDIHNRYSVLPHFTDSFREEIKIWPEIYESQHRQSLITAEELLSKTREHERLMQEWEDEYAQILNDFIELLRDEGVMVFRVWDREGVEIGTISFDLTGFVQHAEPVLQECGY